MAKKIGLLNLFFYKQKGDNIMSPSPNKQYLQIRSSTYILYLQIDFLTSHIDIASTNKLKLMVILRHDNFVFSKQLCLIFWRWSRQLPSIASKYPRQSFRIEAGCINTWTFISLLCYVWLKLILLLFFIIYALKNKIK